jgi:hypothetical protein
MDRARQVGMGRVEASVADSTHDRGERKSATSAASPDLGEGMPTCRTVPMKCRGERMGPRQGAALADALGQQFGRQQKGGMNWSD